jgi:CS domain
MTTRKVVIKRQEDKFQWSQTEESLTFYLPLKNVLMKNIDVLITKDFLKVNASSIRYICVIDFAYPIDYEHPSTKVTLMDEKLEINVFKPADDHKIWEQV